MQPILKAVLGPTNTGKTHYAVERMLGRSSGVIGLPLRLLAREVYDRIAARVGAANVALVTGEEKIVPPHARYFVCTVEAMPVDRRFAFVAIDEVQLMGNHERGHVFTDRVMHMRGYEETLFLGAETARDVIRTLVPDVMFDRRERFSELSYAGPTRLNRLPKRSVVVAFSSKEVYALAEALRRLRGGAAVVMGGLSPRTRNAQAEMFQSGEVDFLVATDAVGMGLNLDTHHVAFAGLSKYDGRRRRYLRPMEAAQIAGRAGRFRTNGTFGTTGDCPEMPDDLVDKIVRHQFEPLHYVEWRNSDLDFSSLTGLVESLHAPRPTKRLRRIKGAEDELSLERMMAIPEVSNNIHVPAQVRQLWDVCSVPDFRNLTIDAHVRLLQDIYRALVSGGGRLKDDFMARKIGRCDDTTGDVDTLSARLARIRTWTYCASKSNWMAEPEKWASEARRVEDGLSDALHEGLIARFVDKRTSRLLRTIGAGADMTASIKDDGSVFVDDQMIGHLRGLQFTRDGGASDLEAKALEAAAGQAVSPEVDRRLTSIASAQTAVFTLSDQGEIVWGGNPVGRIAKSGSIFNPDVELVGGELGNATLRDMALERMRAFLKNEVETHLAPLKTLKELQGRDDILPGSKGFAYLVEENHGSLDRRVHGKTVRDLGPDERRDLRGAGVRFGQYNVWMPEMIRPKPARLLSLLLSYGAGGDRKPFIPFAGVTSIANEGDLASEHYAPQALAVAGYRAVGPRIVRFDILDRLATQVRDAQGQFEKVATDKPKRPTFQIMAEMLAILGSTHAEVQGVLQALGYKSRTEDAPLEKPVVAAEPAPASEAAPATPTPTAPTAADAAASEESSVPEVPAPASTPPASAEIPITDAPAPATPQTPKPSKRERGRARAPLNVYVPRETAEDGTTTELPNLEYWSLAPRQRNAQRGGNRNQQRGSGGGKGRGDYRSKAFKGGRKDRGPRKDRTGQSSGGYSAGKAPRPRKSMENSPFAALAALQMPAKNDAEGKVKADKSKTDKPDESKS